MGTAEINDVKLVWKLPPEELDQYWAAGWRKFGPMFFRYRECDHEGKPHHVVPLRIVLDRFKHSKSQRRVLRRSADLSVRIQPAVIDEELGQMFEMHKARFKGNIPDALENFLGPLPAALPCECVEVAVIEGERRVAASFLDLGREAVSSVYGMFDPELSRRSLGILTMLLEIHYAREHGYRYYYPGYVYEEPSSYDYKRQFAGLERFDWEGNWAAV